MKLPNPVANQRLYLFYGDARSDQSSRLGVIFQPVKSLHQPLRNGGPAALGKPQHLRKASDRQNPRNDGHIDPRTLASIAKTQIDVGVVEELRDRARSPSVDLAFEVIEVFLR